MVSHAARESAAPAMASSLIFILGCPGNMRPSPCLSITAKYHDVRQCLVIATFSYEPRTVASVSLALVEAIGGTAVARSVADRLGVRGWGATHRTADFRIGFGDYVRAAGRSRPSGVMNRSSLKANPQRRASR
ncbi:hypothetical protein D3C77_490530 [compost metagenome]